MVGSLKSICNHDPMSHNAIYLTGHGRQASHVKLIDTTLHDSISVLNDIFLMSVHPCVCSSVNILCACTYIAMHICMYLSIAFIVLLYCTTLSLVAKRAACRVCRCVGLAFDYRCLTVQLVLLQLCNCVTEQVTALIPHYMSSLTVAIPHDHCLALASYLSFR